VSTAGNTKGIEHKKTIAQTHKIKKSKLNKRNKRNIIINSHEIIIITPKVLI